LGVTIVYLCLSSYSDSSSGSVSLPEMIWLLTTTFLCWPNFSNWFENLWRPVPRPLEQGYSRQCGSVGQQQSGQNITANTEDALVRTGPGGPHHDMTEHKSLSRCNFFTCVFLRKHCMTFSFSSSGSGHLEISQILIKLPSVILVTGMSFFPGTSPHIHKLHKMKVSE
jgi:hypothetical protein